MNGGESRVKVALEVVKLADIQMGSIGPQDSDAIVEEEAKGQHMKHLLSLSVSADLSRIRNELIEKGTRE